MYKNIHRVWFGDKSISYDYHFDSFDEFLPGWNNMEWGDFHLESTHKLLKDIDPRVSVCFDKYADHVSLLSDVIRYCALYRYGGIYTDYDVELFSDSYLQKIKEAPNTPLFIVETILPDQMYEASGNFKNRNGVKEHKMRIASYMIYSPPGHPIIKSTIDLIAERLNMGIVPEEDYDIIWLAGPDTISTVVNTTEEKYNLIDHQEQYEFCDHKCTGVRTWRTLF